MILSDLPPGVSAGNPNIDPGFDSWEQVHAQIDADCEKHSLSDMDCWVAWAMGVSAFKIARMANAKFPHD